MLYQPSGAPRVASSICPRNSPVAGRGASRKCEFAHAFQLLADGAGAFAEELAVLGVAVEAEEFQLGLWRRLRHYYGWVCSMAWRWRGTNVVLTGVSTRARLKLGRCGSSEVAAGYRLGPQNNVPITAVQRKKPTGKASGSKTLARTFFCHACYSSKASIRRVTIYFLSQLS